jgi:formamidopyrimidine-DNA glycosylase
MPELPEVETVRRTLAPLLTKRTITAFELHWPRTLNDIDPGEFRRHLVDRSISGVNRRGKLIIFEMEDGWRVTVHLRMTGELLAVPRHASPDSSRSRHLRASFKLDDETLLAFYDVRKFGRISLLSPSSFAVLDTMLGIEPLSPEFTDHRLFAILSSRNRSIKPLLLDQSLIAGLGNIYVDEALFRSGIHPTTRSSALSLEDAGRLRNAIVDILNVAVSRRGTTIRDYRSGLGDQGQNQSYLRIYGLRAGSPCTACSTPVVRITVGQRGTVYCPRCQPAHVTPDTPHRSICQPPDHRD